MAGGEENPLVIVGLVESLLRVQMGKNAESMRESKKKRRLILCDEGLIFRVDTLFPLFLYPVIPFCLCANTRRNLKFLFFFSFADEAVHRVDSLVDHLRDELVWERALGGWWQIYYCRHRYSGNQSPAWSLRGGRTPSDH